MILWRAGVRLKVGELLAMNGKETFLDMDKKDVGDFPRADKQDGLHLFSEGGRFFFVNKYFFSGEHVDNLSLCRV